MPKFFVAPFVLGLSYIYSPKFSAPLAQFFICPSPFRRLRRQKFLLPPKIFTNVPTCHCLRDRSFTMAVGWKKFPKKSLYITTPSSPSAPDFILWPLLGDWSFTIAPGVYSGIYSRVSFLQFLYQLIKGPVINHVRGWSDVGVPKILGFKVSKFGQILSKCPFFKKCAKNGGSTNTGGGEAARGVWNFLGNFSKMILCVLIFKKCPLKGGFGSWKCSFMDGFWSQNVP